MGLSLLLNRLHFFATLLVVQAFIWVSIKFRFFIVLTGQAVGMLIPAPQQAAIVICKPKRELLEKLANTVAGKLQVG
jgi:hypothetical protein